MSSWRKNESTARAELSDWLALLRIDEPISSEMLAAAMSACAQWRVRLGIFHATRGNSLDKRQADGTMNS